MENSLLSRSFFYGLEQGENLSIGLYRFMKEDGLKKSHHVLLQLAGRLAYLLVLSYQVSRFVSFKSCNKLERTLIWKL